MQSSEKLLSRIQATFLHNRPVQVGLALFLTLLFGLLGYLLSRPQFIARLERAEGSIERDYSERENTWSEAQTRSLFHEGDGARTGRAEEAEFELINGARLLLSEQSQIRFMRPNQQGDLGLDIELGNVVVLADQPLTIESEFGPLQFERGSRVALSRSGDRLQIQVELGQIELGDGQRIAADDEAILLDLGGIAIEGELAEPEEAPAQEETKEEAFSLQPGEHVPGADLFLTPGESIFVHDPSPPSVVGFRRPDACEKGVVVKVGPRRAAGQEGAHLRLAAGSYEYSVACAGAEEEVVAQGRVVVLQDGAARPLPSFAPSLTASADGRSYTTLYVHRLPRVTFRWDSAPDAEEFQILVDGRTINTRSPVYTFQSGTLRPGTHELTYLAKTEPQRRSRKTKVVIRYDAQAPKAQLSAARPSEGGYQVSGQVLPGWSASVDGEELPLDGSRRFKVERAEDESLPVVYRHPSQGVHYYLRRPPATQ